MKMESGPVNSLRHNDAWFMDENARTRELHDNIVGALNAAKTGVLLENHIIYAERNYAHLTKRLFALKNLPDFGTDQAVEDVRNGLLISVVTGHQHFVAEFGSILKEQIAAFPTYTPVLMNAVLVAASRNDACILGALLKSTQPSDSMMNVIGVIVGCVKKDSATKALEFYKQERVGFEPPSPVL